ncbi:hypothetical protein UZ36_02410 [Candidatus Nitromaritima sp. SCGC AAA799-C22]|nr:hypothetical protein UZ36_02410 [Candidatus Nitromaritima sp. SCGC AAA799-C22]
MAEEDFSIDTRPTGAFQTPNRNQAEGLQNQVQEDNERDNAIAQADNDDAEEQNNRVQAENDDRVEITAEAREQNQAERADGGERGPVGRTENQDTPEVDDQQGAERGARQRVENQEDENARGFAPEDATAGAQSVVSRQSDSEVNNPPGTPNDEIRNLGNTAESRDGTRLAEVENPVVEEARAATEPTPTGVQQQTVREALDETEEQQARVEAREAPLFDQPTPFEAGENQPVSVEEIVQEDLDRATEPPPPLEQQQSDRLDQEPRENPAAVQTEVGQNVDRLI